MDSNNKGVTMDFKTIRVKNGNLEIEVCNYGATLTRLLVPDAKGEMGDIVLGFETPKEYTTGRGFFGASVGRVCNRIGGGKAVIDGEEYVFDVNETARGNCLHGGKNSFDKMMWDIRECSGEGWKGVHCHLLSPDMQNGFPGNLDIVIVYKLTDENELEISYQATTDKPTICSLTNHSYFDLSAGKSKDVLSQKIKICADFFTPVDSNMVTTGEVLSVAGTALDLREYKPIGEGIASDDPNIAIVGGGYDHNFVLRNQDGGLVHAASAIDEVSGRKMDVYTTETGIQFYSGTFLPEQKGKNGGTSNKFGGFALETQAWPDSCNKPHFPSVALFPDELYQSTTIYKFSKNV